MIYHLHVTPFYQKLLCEDQPSSVHPLPLGIDNYLRHSQAWQKTASKITKMTTISLSSGVCCVLHQNPVVTFMQSCRNVCRFFSSDIIHGMSLLQKHKVDSQPAGMDCKSLKTCSIGCRCWKRSCCNTKEYASTQILSSLLDHGCLWKYQLLLFLQVTAYKARLRT